MKLKNKIALITGGTSGIGLEAAKLFQSEGATVIVTGTNAERLANAASILGEGAVTLSVDLRDPTQIDKAIADVVETFGRIDVIFANAGAGTAAPLEAVTAEQVMEMAQSIFRPEEGAVTLLGRLDGLKLTRRELAC